MNPTIDTRRALTVQAPWAWAIVAGLKTVENRTWPTRHRGRLHIHVGLKQDDAAMPWMENYLKHHAPGFADNPGWLLRGGIIGHVDVIGCDADNTSDPFEIPGVYHWRLANATILPFERCRGAQGIWRIGDQKRVIELPEGFTIKTRMNKAGPTFIATLYRDGASIGEFEKADRIEAQRAATALALELHALPPPSLLTGDDCACGTPHTA